MEYDLLLVGRPSCDLIFTGLPRWPALGQEVYARGLAVHAGGPFNVAAAAGRLGLKVGLVSVLGNDFWSDFLLRQFEAEGLTTALVLRVDRPLPTVSVALNLDGDRGFVTYEAEAEVVEGELLAHLDRVLTNNHFRHAHFSLGPNLPDLVARIKRRGMTVSVSTWGQESWLRSPCARDLVRYADVMLANEIEALTLTGTREVRAAVDALAGLCPWVVVTRGPRGAVAAVGGRVVEVTTVPVQAVDATGAGDCFIAGFLYGWLRGMPPEVCLALGNLCGGEGVKAVGGYTGAPTEARLLELARARGLEVNGRPEEP